MEINSSKQIKIGAIISYLALGINIFFGLIYTPWMINSIGRENYGLFTLAMSVITLFVFDFGLSNAITRFLSKYLAEGRQDKTDNCLGIVAKLYLYIDIVIFVVLASFYFFIPLIYRELTPEEVEKFKVVYVVAAIFAVVSFPFIPLNGILTSYEKFIQLKICDLIHKFLVVGSMSICLLIGYGLYALVLVNALSGVATIVMKLWCIKHYTKATVRLSYSDKKEIKDILSFSGWTTILSIAQRMIFTIAPTILGIFSGSVPIAIFGIATSLESYVYLFSTALSGMFLPRVSQILATGNGDIMPLMIKIGRIQLMIAGAVIMGFIVLGEDFIHLWVGSGFSDSYWCTVLLILPSLIQLPQEIGIQAIVAENKVKQQAMVYFLMAIINILLSLLLTWRYDAIGMSVSICISYIVRTIGLDIIFKKELHLNLGIFFKQTFAKLGTMIMVVTLFTIPICYWISSNIEVPYLSFVINALVFLSSYFIGLAIVSNEYERELIISPVKRIFK